MHTTIDQRFNEKANSPSEMLDLVDENDMVIGTVPRPEANCNPSLTHREVSVLLFDEQKRVVIQKRSTYKAVHPNMWSMVAGHISAGEDPEKTAYSELAEEFGITDIPLRFLTKKYVRYPHESHFMYYYMGTYSGQKIIFDESEVSAIKILSQEELRAFIASGESFNTKYLPLLEEIWSGIYDN